MASTRPLHYILGFVCLCVSQWLFAADWIYVVQPGDTVWEISRKYLADGEDWPKVRRYNNIERDKVVRPGTRLRIPLKWLKPLPAEAEVTGRDGEPLIYTDEQGRRPEAQTLGKGTTLVTTAGERFKLKMPDTSTVTVSPSSGLNIDGLTRWEHTGVVAVELTLVRGELYAHVLPRHGIPTLFTVRIGVSEVAVQSGQIRVRHSPDLRSQVEVVRGHAVVTTPQGEVDLYAGLGVALDSVGNVLDRRALPPPPQLTKSIDPIRHLPAQLSWPPVEDAERYLMQLTEAEESDTLRYQKYLEGSSAELSGVSNGAYHILLRAVDENGIEGIETVRRLYVDLALAPPLVEDPLKGAQVAPDNTLFGWIPSGADHYTLQVAKDPLFNEIIIDRSGIQGHTYRSERPLLPGRYFWRIAAASDEGEQGSFSETIPFRVRKALPPPQEVETGVEGDQLSVSWEAVEGAVAYRVQLARDPDFELVVKEVEEVGGTEWSFDELASGDYFVRVSPVEQDGYSDNFSQPVKTEHELGAGWKLPAILFVLILLFY